MLWREGHFNYFTTMAKRVLAILLLLPFALIGFAAKLTATLQSGDNVTPFYGANAFVEAYNASVDGDIITLSPGKFNPTNISKSITVIGSYAFDEDQTKATIISSNSVNVDADNVHLEGIRFSNINTSLMLKGCDHLTVNRCYIWKMTDEENGEKKYHDNTILSDCLVNDYEAMSLSKNTVLRNCCINYFSDKNENSYPALIENCNIPLFSYFDKFNSPNEYRYRQPYAIYRNCFIGLYAKGYNNYGPRLDLYSPSEFQNCIFWKIYYYTDNSGNFRRWTINFVSAVSSNVINNEFSDASYGFTFSISSFQRYSSFTPLVRDNIIYGPDDHKEYPAIPAIISSEIDTETDVDGNLHVKISATARD